jgi:peptidoglycan DL-endopeptidase CwlO
LLLHSTAYVSDVLNWAARYTAGGAPVISAASSPLCQQAALGPLPPGTAGKVIAYAEAQLGKPYQWGATGPDAYDCSGLAMMAYRAAGIDIPRTSQQQWAYGKQVPASQARPGDLVFFAGSDGTPSSPGHVGIVVAGHDMMIDAPTAGQTVTRKSFEGSTDLVGFTRP